MGFMDSFTSDGTVEMKHEEYYRLMREAAKAELAANAVKCGVPHNYINEMLTGKPEAVAEITEALPEVESNPDWDMESILTAARHYMAEMTDEKSISWAARTLYGVIALAQKERLEKVILENDGKLRAREQEKDNYSAGRTPDAWACETCTGNVAPDDATGRCADCEDGSNYEEAATLAADNTDREQDPEESEESENGND